MRAPELDENICEIMDFESDLPALLETLPSEIRREIHNICYGNIECAAEIILEYVPMMKPRDAAKILMRLVQHLLARIDALEGNLAEVEAELENKAREIEGLRYENYELERKIEDLEWRARRKHGIWAMM